MRITAIVIILLAISGLSVAKASKRLLKCGKKHVLIGSIWNGNNTEVNSWPWLVALRHIGIFICGGSLVSAKHVVSAAHCFQNKNEPTKKFPADVTALVGKHNLRVENEKGSAEHGVLDIILHNDWKYQDVSFDADISLIILENEVDLSQRDKVGTVCLPPQSDDEVVGIGSVAGWGISKRSVANLENFDTTPNEVELPAIKQSVCTESDKFFLGSSDRTFCAGFINQDKSTCAGDSGGGFYQLNRSTKTYGLTGIVSSSLFDPKLEPCRADNYNIFTNVRKFVNWIEENMKKTKELKWEKIEMKCDYDEDRFPYAYSQECSTTGPYTRFMKIQLHFSNASNVEELGINFRSSEYIFNGIGKNFPKLKNLQIRSGKTIRFVEKQNFIEMEQLQNLNLDFNEIEFLSEDSFSKLVNLNILWLSENKIKNLPENIFSKLANLSQLSLSYNQIRELAENIFSNLANLSQLSLSFNQIKKLPDNVFLNLVSLNDLNLNKNQIEEIPENIFSNLANLNQLSFSQNQIKELPVNIFSNLKKIVWLSFSNNKINFLHRDLLLHNRELKELFIYNNPLKTIDIDFTLLKNLKLHNQTYSK